MKNKIILTTAICVVLSAVLLSGCGADFVKDPLSVTEQPDIIIQESAKIYPSQVGNVLVDKKVDCPVIDAFMKKYNANAKNTAKIEYDAIYYNAERGYYYVNDVQKSRGIKFRLDKSNQIISASVYSGNLSDKQTDLVSMTEAAAQTMGYKSLMSDTDKAKISGVLNGYSSTQGTISEALPTFQNGLQLTLNMDNLFADVDLEGMVFNDEFVSSANQDVADVVNDAKDKNANNPADPSGGEKLTLQDEFQQNFADEIGEKLNGIQGETASSVSGGD